MICSSVNRDFFIDASNFAADRRIVRLPLD
jgi:hypothetical protein